MKCPNCGEENEYNPNLNDEGNVCVNCFTPISMMNWIAGVKKLEMVLKKDIGNARVMEGNRWLYWLAPNWIVRELKPYHKKPVVLYCGTDLEAAAEYLYE